MGVYVRVEPILSDREWSTLITIKLQKHRIKILVDCGISDSFNSNSIKKLLTYSTGIQYILLTHSTIDHIGGLPLLMRKYSKLRNKPQLICTEPIYKLAKSNFIDLIESMLFNIPKSKLQYSIEDVDISLSNPRLLRYNEHIYFDSSIDDISLYAINSGYSVGGSAFILTIGTKQIMIAKKISLVSKWHLNSLSLDTINNPYLMITDLPKLSINACLFQSSLDMVINKTINTLKNGNCVLIPIDLDSTLIELLHHFELCWKRHYIAKWPIIIASPIASKISLIFSTSIEYMSLKVKSEFSQHLKNPLIFDNIICVDKLEQLKPFTNIPCIIFSTPSSLNWGFSNALFAAIGSKKGNLIILTKEPETKSLARRICLYTSKVGTNGIKINKYSNSDKSNFKRKKFNWLFKYNKPFSINECYELYKKNQIEIDSEINNPRESTMQVDDSADNDAEFQHESQSFFEPSQNINKTYSIISNDPLAHLKFNKSDTGIYPTFSDKSNFPFKSDIEDDYGLSNQFSELWKTLANPLDEDKHDEQIESKNEQPHVEDMIDVGQKLNAHDEITADRDTPFDYYHKLYKSLNTNDNTTNHVHVLQNDWLNSLIRWFGKMPSRYVQQRIRQRIRARILIPIGLDTSIDQYSLDTLIGKLKFKKTCILSSNDKSVYKYKIESNESLIECCTSLNDDLSNINTNRLFIFDQILDKCTRSARKNFRLLNLKVKFTKINEGNEPKISFWQSKQPCLYSMDLYKSEANSFEDSKQTSNEAFNEENEYHFPNIPIFKVAETFNELLPGQISVVGRHSAIVIASKTVIQRVDDGVTKGKKWLLRGSIDPTYYLARKTLYALNGNPF